MNDEKLRVLLERSGEFQADVHEFASGLIPVNGTRHSCNRLNPEKLVVLREFDNEVFISIQFFGQFVSEN